MKKFAAFDIDGTLIRWQLYHAVVDHLAQKNLLGPDASEQLRQARMRWKKREHPEAFREYELALIDIFEAALDKLSPEQFDTATKKVVEEYGEQTYVFTRNLIAELKAKNYVLLAISGSHDEIVGHVAKQYGFDDWIGTRYKRENEGFSKEDPFIASHHKKVLLEQMIKKHGLSKAESLAIGDSGSDAAMLEIVEQPIAFNPDQALLGAAKKNGWKIVIERKNVVYELEDKDGRYVLA
jgi:HAD superfamily hydrolase (TIGR01490 family)